MNTWLLAPEGFVRAHRKVIRRRGAARSDIPVIDSDAYLLHQIHPGKLATDITAGIASPVLMWQRCMPAALVVGQVPPLVASAVVIRCDLSELRDTRWGRYVLVHMPPAAQAVRLLGQIMAWRAA
jgi:hypothetical protein